MGVDPDGSPYFVMEQFSGETLGDLIKKMSIADPAYLTQYSPSSLLDIFASICNAVAYAHSRHIIHLDLKPENIHINSYGQVHVCDWGLAKVVNSDEEPEQAVDQDLSHLDPNIINTMTLNGEIKGTPGFMAPEQAVSGGIKDKQTDVYALGALLYNLLSYTLPVAGNTAEELIRNTREGKVQSIHLVDPKVPESLAAIAHKALQKEPKKRYESVDSLREDVDRYRHGFPSRAENAGFFIQLKLLIKRNKTTSLLVAAFLLFSVIGGAIAFKRIDTQRNLALEAKIAAEKHQKKAEDSLSLYLKERQLTEKQDRNIDQLLFEIASREDLTKPLQQMVILEQGLERTLSEKQRESFYAKLGILNFVMQDFDEAGKYLTLVESDQSIKQLLSAIKKYGHLNKKNELLTDKDFADLINYLSHNQRYIIPFMYHQHMRRSKKSKRQPQDYWPLAKAMLMMVNNYWNTEPLDRPLVSVEGGYSLDLSHTRYRTFRCHSEAFSISILEPLKLKSLNLSHTPFFEFWQLNGLKLDTINLTGCWVREINLSNLSALKLMGLKEIRLDSALYSKESIEALKKSFKVIETQGDLRSK
jgi:hypothetical protein